METLYYPCVIDNKTGKISKRVAKAMPREKAENYLKKNFRAAWLRAEAIPQPINHPYFKK